MATKYASFEDMKGLIDVALFIGDVYNKNSKPSNMRILVLCRKFANYSITILILLSASYTIDMLLLLLPGVFISFATGQSVPLLRITSIYSDQHSPFNIALEWIINILYLLTCFIMVFTYDALTYIIFLNMLMVSSIIAAHFADMKEALLDTATTLRDTKYRLHAIILMILKYNA